MVKAVALFSVLFASVTAHAQLMTAGKIAVLDPEAAVLSTDEAQKRLKALAAQPEFDKDKKEFERLAKEGQDMQKQMQKDASIMSPAQKEEARKKLEGKASDIEYLRRKLAAKQQEAMQGIMEEMQAKYTKAVTDLLKSENIGLLLNKRAAVMHADNSYDITSKVTEAMNKAGGQ
ncbi:MAG: OmpH family outer membrane protein [Spongiibacteraceae bacterium]